MEDGGMNCTIDEYIADVKSQLTCNATKEYSEVYITYTYTNNQIDSNINYFEKCLKDGLSAYKALLFFNEYLNEKKYD